MSGSQTDNPSQIVSAQLRGETMAYAVQSAVYNLGANLFEPYVNYRTQKYFSSHHHNESYGSYAQNLTGEIAGDLIGSSTLIAAEALCPEALHGFTRAARRLVDPLYSSVAHRVFADKKNEPDYEQAVQKWKTFQERSLVRSAIMATAGIAGNLATQKWLVKNPSPTHVIFAGKLISTALTTTLGLTSRLVFPEQTRNVDRWMSQHLFAPMMQDKMLESHDDQDKNPASPRVESKTPAHGEVGR